MSRATLSTLLVAALLLTACGIKRGDFSDFRQLPDEGWAYGDTVMFSPAENDSIPLAGNIEIAVCHGNDYQWSNLWLEVSYPTKGGSLLRDTVELVLADDYGHWQGNGFGSSYQLSKRLPKNFTLHKGTRFSVRHIMRVDTLKGISSVGLRFLPSNP